MHLKVIGTGSQGNAYALIHNNRALLLDAGVSENKILKEIGFDISVIDAVLISHSHLDHFKSAEQMLNCFVPVVMPQESANCLSVQTFRPNLYVANDKQYVFGKWTIKSFPLEHDESNYGYLIYNSDTKQKIFYATDTGFIRATPIGINVLIIECNYVNALIHTEEMEDRFRRVKETHMSLERLESYLKKIDLSKLTHIVLVHLSDTNSDEEYIVRTIKNLTGVSVTAARNGKNINLDEIPF